MLVAMYWLAVVIASIIALLADGVGACVVSLFAGWVFGLFVYE